MKFVYFKLKKNLRGHPAGRILRTPCDDNGVVINFFWRRRVEDSENDGCLEVLRKIPKSGVLNA